MIHIYSLCVLVASGVMIYSCYIDGYNGDMIFVSLMDLGLQLYKNFPIVTTLLVFLFTYLLSLCALAFKVKIFDFYLFVITGCTLLYNLIGCSEIQNSMINYYTTSEFFSHLTTGSLTVLLILLLLSITCKKYK